MGYSTFSEVSHTINVYTDTLVRNLIENINKKQKAF